MPVTFICEWCNKEETRRGNRKGTYWSMECKAEAQRAQKPVDEDWLRRKYLKEGLSTYDIADIVDRDSKRVWEWLKGYDIPTRPRGHQFEHGEGNHYSNLDMEGPFKGRTHTEETREKISEAALGPRPHLRGEKNGMYGRTDEDNPNYKGGVTPERQAFYASQEWKDACRTVWQRDDATCQRCGVHRSESDEFHVHHIVSFAVEERRADPDNLVLLCEKCHHWIHSSENTNNEFLAE